MLEVLQQSEPTNTKRRVFFRLIDSSDTISGKVITTTGVKVSLSKNGGVAFNSSADITAVDMVNQPGEYYLELTSSECDTVGQLTGFLQPSGCLGARLQCSVVGYDPYAAKPTVVTIADTFLDRTDAIESGLTPRQLFRLVGAVLLGKSSGLDTNTAVFRSAVSDSKVRVTATEDASGNRSLIITDAT